MLEHVKADLASVDAAVTIVKTADTNCAKEYGIDTAALPQIVYFENGIPSLYPGSQKLYVLL